MIDYLMQGFEQRETMFMDMQEELEGEMEYPTESNLALAPEYGYVQPKFERDSLKVVNHPSYKGHEVMVIEPRSFDDAAQIAVYLKERKTVVLNLHLLDKEQSQRTIDFICGAAHALNGRPQKVGELVFVFTPSNVTLSVEAAAIQNKFDGALWGKPL